MGESRQMERQAHRLDVVARWADDLAHEVKNPLHAMVINLELVKRRAGGDPDAVVERAEVVEAELHRVHRLIDSLLRLVRPWPVTGTASVEQVFEVLLPVFSARAGVRKVQYSHEAGSGIVTMPPGDLALVLVDLVDRALDAMPDGGTLVTRVEPGDGDLRIVVSDSGAGGAEADLGVSRRLLREVGGSLRFGPVAEGEGTEAVVSLPVSGSA